MNVFNVKQEKTKSSPQASSLIANASQHEHYQSQNQSQNHVHSNQKAWLKIIICFWCFVFIIFFSHKSHSAEIAAHNEKNNQQSYRTYKAIEYYSSANETTPELASKLTELTKQNSLNTAAISRKQYLAEKQKSANKLAQTKLNAQVVAAKIHWLEFSIYDGYTQLIDDIDGDGYYQTFNLAFDADVYSYDENNQAKVYAEIYLSQDQGPWQYFHTTDDFIIYGESADDEYQVLSNLTSGYRPAGYDILIELYQSGYSGIVASHSSDDNNQLYALPLESDEFDRIEPHSHSGGSIGIVLISLLVMIWLARWQHSKQRIIYRESFK
ncbi:choice-of-anchor H family protein [Colwellia sp. MEBiC06753]